MTPELQKELQELQKRMAVELEPLVLESSLTMQKIIEAEDHKARCHLMKHFMLAETTRLTAKKSLQGIFSSESDAVTLESDMGAIPPEEMIPSSESEEKKSSAFYDEPDAFQ